MDSVHQILPTAQVKYGRVIMDSIPTRGLHTNLHLTMKQDILKVKVISKDSALLDKPTHEKSSIVIQ